jgi:hypothetical protein
MNRKFQSILLFLLFSISCEKKEPEGYSICNNMLICTGSDSGEYCTFGYKWGAGNPFPNAGSNKPGPAIGPVIITYTFLEAGNIFSTHSQKDLISKSFDDPSQCFKDTIRNALSEWEAITAITFVETNDPTSNIRFVMGDITQAGVAFPPFPDKPCSDLGGQIAIKFNPNRSCESLYMLALHEIGHALGLGHVQSNNVMNPDKVYSELQPGDVQGIKSIYGEK